MTLNNIDSEWIHKLKCQNLYRRVDPFCEKTIINAVDELDWNIKTRDRSWDVLLPKIILLNVKRSGTLNL